MRPYTFLAAISLFFALGSAAQPKYVNPVLYSDYSDPDVEAVNGEFWFTSSSFNCVPGLQILHSYNLVDWDIVGAALPASSPYWDDVVAHPDHGNSVWAPSIRYRKSNGRFYIFWGDADRGVFQVNTDDPRGAWTDPVCVLKGKGLIDACPLFDDNGRVYMVHGWAGSRAGFKSALCVCELDAECTRVISEQVLVFDGNKNDNLTVEGPKFYKHDGWYWIFAPAGGVKTGWQLALRSKSPYGPYEWKRVCEAADPADVASGRAVGTNAPHQGGWVPDCEGKYWFMHFEDREAWGRIVHLQPMEWTSDGWCVIGNDVDGDGIGEPVRSWTMPASVKDAGAVALSGVCTEADFTHPYIPLNWQWHGQPSVDWAMTNPAGGTLRLNCIVHQEGWRNLWDTSNLLLEKVVGPATELTSKLVFRPSYPGDRSGMIVMGHSYGTIEMYYDGETVQLQRRDCRVASEGAAEQVLASLPLATEKIADDIQYCTVYLRVRIEDQPSRKGVNVWPPVVQCTFSYSLDGKKYKPFGPVFIASPGHWIGAKVGYFATADIKKNDGGSVEIH